LSAISPAGSHLSPKTKWRMARRNGLRVDILNNFPSSQAIFGAIEEREKSGKSGNLL